MKRKIQILLLLALGGSFSASAQSGSPFFSYVDTVFCQNEADPLPLILNGTGPTFTGTAGLTIDSISGEIDLSASISGTHIISLQLTNPIITLSQTISINQADDPAYSYPGTICEGATNPIASINQTGGIFSGSVSFVNPSSGEIDLNTTNPGSYLIQYRTNGTCPDSLSQIVTITAREDASFLYPDTMYCGWPGFAHPQILGQGGGIFSCFNPGLELDSLDGRINLSQSSYGTFWVDYMTGGVCPDTHRAVVGVAPPAFAEFEYTPDRYCLSDPNPTAIVTGDTNGVFSVANGNVSINSQTGEIDLLNSIPGDSILIKYRAPGYLWGCPDSMVRRIRIYAPDPSISITYPDSAYCQDATDPTPTINGPSGGVFQSVPPGVQFTNIQSGQIDLSGSSPGTYEIRYFPPGSCADTSGGFRITVHSADQIGVYYGESSRCQHSMPIAPIGLPNGSFFASDSGLVFADSTMGVIVPELSQPGAYLIGYQTSGACPTDTLFPFSILDSPNPEFLSPADGMAICEGEEIDVLVMGGNRFMFSQNGSPVQALSVNNIWSPQTPPNNGDTITVLAINDNGCEGQDTLVMSIQQRPSVEILEAPGTTIEDSKLLKIFYTTDLDSTEMHWTRIASGPVYPNEVKGSSPVLRGGSVWWITDSISIRDNSPSLAKYWIWGETNGCTGLRDSVEVEVLPGSDGIFIPGAITPNGNGQNDEWEIRTGEGINPAEYSIEVFNRSGGMVYQQSGLYRGWNGSGLADGTYWYVVRDKSMNVVRANGLKIIRK